MSKPASIAASLAISAKSGQRPSWYRRHGAAAQRSVIAVGKVRAHKLDRFINFAGHRDKNVALRERDARCQLVDADTHIASVTFRIDPCRQPQNSNGNRGRRIAVDLKSEHRVASVFQVVVADIDGVATVFDGAV